MAYIDDLKMRYPVDYLTITQAYRPASNPTHNGVDLGWNGNYGGQNVPLYAPADGVVNALQEGMNNNTSAGSSWGNYVKISHGNNVYTLCGHMLKGSINAVGLKVGQTVKRGQKIGQMNNSGYSFGSHCHFEVYLGGTGTGYRVDPLKYMYVYTGMTVSPSSLLRDKLLYNNGPAPAPPATGIGSPVARDENHPQIEVLIDTLNVRQTSASDGKVLGSANKGFYYADNLPSVVVGGYNRVNIQTDMWIAENEKDGWTKFYPKKVDAPPIDDSKDKEIAALKANVEVLKNLNNGLSVSNLGKNSVFTEIIKTAEGGIKT